MNAMGPGAGRAGGMCASGGIIPGGPPAPASLTEKLGLYSLLLVLVYHINGHLVGRTTVAAAVAWPPMSQKQHHQHAHGVHLASFMMQCSTW
jgi:hypothetical protein